MLLPNYRAELYKLDGTDYATTPIILNDITSLNTTAGTETRKDTFKISFQNKYLSGIWNKASGFSEQTNNFIRVGDLVRIYVWLGSVQPTNLDSYMIMDGEVTKYSYDTGEDELLFTIDGVNRTENLLSTMVPYSTGSSYNTAPTIITQILSRVNKFNSYKQPLTYGLTSGTNVWTGSAGLIQAVKSDGASFGSVAYHQNYKSAYEQLEDLSKPEITGDDEVGNYIYYVKYSANVSGDGFVNELVWKSKTFTTSGSFKEGEDFSDYSISYDLRDVVNAMIVSAGEDCYGHGKTTLVINNDSIGKYGAKWKFYPATNIIPDLIKAEKLRGEAAGSTFDTNIIPTTSGSWQFHFQGRNDDGTTNGSLMKVKGATQYNDALRNEGKWLAQEEAQKIVDALGSPKYSIGFDLINPSEQIQLGDLYHIQVPSFGWDGDSFNPSKKLRLYQIDYNVNNSGLTLSVDFEEDEKTVGVQ